MNKIITILLLVSFIGGGCARIEEVGKTLWGSSTRALEDAREEAISKIFSMNVDDAFKNALVIANLQKWEVFIQDKRRHMIVVMGVRGAVNTTEIGIFVTAVADKQSKVEVSSLSSSAKRIVADILFTQWDHPIPLKEEPIEKKEEGQS